MSSRLAGCGTLAGWLATSLLLAGCESLVTKKAGGDESEIVVLCEKAIWEEVKPFLSAALEKEIFTPTAEFVFDIRRVDWENFSLYRHRRNLLVLGALGAKSPISELIADLLSQEAKDAAMEGKAHLFGREDAWAEGQLLLVVTAPQGTGLGPLVERQGPGIYKFFDEGRTERIGKKIYEQGYQEETARHLKESYGWSLRLPLGYRIGSEDSAGQFVSFIRHYPDRVISIFWRDGKEWKIDRTACLSQRNYVGSRYFEGDEIIPERTKTEWVDFRNWRALRLKGIWHNDERVMGGPFQTYCFYHEGQQRLYVLDFHVFAPGRKKLAWLKELDTICQTFETR